MQLGDELETNAGTYIRTINGWIFKTKEGLVHVPMHNEFKPKKPKKDSKKTVISSILPASPSVEIVKKKKKVRKEEEEE